VIDADECWSPVITLDTDLFVKLRRTGPTIKEDAPLQMLTNALSLWKTRHFGDLLDAMLA
jgi:hypothetical protein